MLFNNDNARGLLEINIFSENPEPQSFYYKFKEGEINKLHEGYIIKLKRKKLIHIK